ncbi:hypothetical protein ASE49_08665 [Novosphingobium sp. Leaf2]|nr:hypothetical protein ASE49_08665 [Novosphingobium sp. Leaf2]
MDPIVHYLRHGRHEGRSTNVTLSAGIHTDEAAIDPDLPYVVVGVHESSKTGAPIVGLDLARELAQTYNVIFVTLRDGPLVEIARGLFPVVMVASQNKADNTMFLDYIAERYDVKDAFFSSGCCGAFLYPMSAGKYRITCLIHEFLEYMLPDHHAVLACDLLVFSSKELLKSWQYMLDSYNRDPDTVMVLPQPASATNSRRMSKAEARKAVADAAGLDIDDDTTLVLGAGQVQIRKGTDIFLQIGSQLKREAGKFVSVWIGEQISELELSFGVYFHVQIDRCRDENGVCPVHFEPAGPLYPILMDAADVFLVTSRLDPLPNVALDAAARDMPVIAFAGATGLADIAEQGEMNLIEVEMGAVDEVIAAIKANTAQPAAGKRFAVSGASMSSGEGADRQGSRQRHHVDTGVA